MQTAALRQEGVQIDVGRDARRLPIAPERRLDVEDMQHGCDGDKERVVREVTSGADPENGQYQFRESEIR